MTENSKLSTRVLAWLGLCSVLLSTILMPATAQAQSSPTLTPSGLLVESREGALHLQWQGSVQAASTGESAAPTTPYGGYLLPLQTLFVELPAGQPASEALATAAIQGMSSTPYAGELTPAPQIDPPALDWEPSPLNQPTTEAKLPTAPIFVMAEGMQRGRHLATLGFSPIYQDADTGEVRSVDSFTADLAGVVLAQSSDTTADPVAALAGAPGPTNPLANSNAIKLFVGTAGMQQITGADLATAGVVSPSAGKIRIFYRGVQVPLHIIDGNSNNVFESADAVRFYAPSAGDAWNAEGVYWLTVGSEDGLRMGQRSVAAGTAQARNSAYEVGRYVNNKIYETTLAGGDGDNWFQANLSTDSANPSVNVTLTHQLPLNNSLPTLLDLHLTPYAGSYSTRDQNDQPIPVPHRLQFSTTGYSFTQNWGAPLVIGTPFQNQTLSVSLASAADKWTITLLNESSKRGVMVDTIDHLLPVTLNFGGKGAIFQGLEDTWRYQLSNTPTNTPGGRGLYDITDPAQPQRLTIPAGANFEMQDGPTAHRYLLTGDGTLATPRVAAHTPVDLASKSAAHTVYIAPQQFHATLQPLVDLRKSQGYQVRVVDVQAIYDAWSYGMVDAKAIRSFLRYAAGTWTPAPIAAVLVGDTTYDPLNYLGYNTPSYIPPYIANVDPWIKYVPCDSCYGQLDGDDPTTETGFLIDLWIGRFPVINTTELAVVVDKLVRYEKAKDTNPLWRRTSLQIADDDVRPDGSVDNAGPFVGSAEHIITLMPKQIRHLRNYFFAATDYTNVSAELMTLLTTLQAWFANDPAQAMRRSIDLMNSGVGLVTYTGHANHWQWARIVPDDAENKWLFGLWEVRQLRNREMPFISLSMTCYTSQFHMAAASHFTIDEHLFLHANGGAIATWGPTGFSIVPAHDILQAGFHEKLWSSPPETARIGELTEAGYTAIAAHGTAYLDVNKTFAIMGDPLTRARITTDADATFMPKLNR
ncbi:MAG: hypothetical protein IT328_17880 [Caldilineaceae bacterium]|nr:hypothetical protein [Caldilineaceae bacterium]